MQHSNKTLIVLNPYAAGGKAGRLWSQIEPALWEQLGDLVVAITHNPAEVANHLEAAHAVGISRIISIGGDGTNHAVVNALADFQRQNPHASPIVYGMIPVGTGRDWARSQGIPLDIKKAVRWVMDAKPRPTDIGLLTLHHKEEQVHFLNIASVGLGGDVDWRVNRVKKRRPWTFLKATVEAILSYQPQHMRITLDNQPWYDDRAYVVVVANGTTFGHGMRVAPHASVSDGLFDVVLLEARPPIEILAALQRVYRATHLTHPAVHFERAREVHIESKAGALDLDLDGEHATGDHISFTVKPQLLHLLS